MSTEHLVSSPVCLQTGPPAEWSGYVHLAGLRTGHLCAFVPTKAKTKQILNTIIIFLSSFFLCIIQAQNCGIRVARSQQPAPGTLLRHLIRAFDISGTKNSPSCRPAASSCPTYRPPEIARLTIDLLSHRAFSTVIPNSRHSCGAKIDPQSCPGATAKPILDCDSALLGRHGRHPAGIGYTNWTATI